MVSVTIPADEADSSCHAPSPTLQTISATLASPTSNAMTEAEGGCDSDRSDCMTRGEAAASPAHKWSPQENIAQQTATPDGQSSSAHTEQQRSSEISDHVERSELETKLKELDELRSRLAGELAVVAARSPQPCGGDLGEDVLEKQNEPPEGPLSSLPPKPAAWSLLSPPGPAESCHTSYREEPQHMEPLAARARAIAALPNSPPRREMGSGRRQAAWATSPTGASLGGGCASAGSSRQRTWARALQTNPGDSIDKRISILEAKIAEVHSSSDMHEPQRNAHEFHMAGDGVIQEFLQCTETPLLRTAHNSLPRQGGFHHK